MEKLLETNTLDSWAVGDYFGTQVFDNRMVCFFFPSRVWVFSPYIEHSTG